MQHSIQDQLKRSRGLLLAFYLPALAVVVGIGIASVTAGMPVAMLTRDPAAVTGSNPAIGALSNMGILGWAATAAVTLFTAWVLGKSTHAGRPTRGFFLAAGLITVVLMVDDLFMVHEQLAESRILRERYCFSVYLALLGAFVVCFRASLWRTNVLPLGLAFGLFAGSIGVDILPEDILPAHHLVEDGLKFLGIVGWFAYFSQTARGALRGDRES